MNILVCVKYVPDATAAPEEINKRTKSANERLDSRP